MSQMQFINEYLSLNHQIREGYAFAISSIWYREFQRFLDDMTGVDVERLGQIVNAHICEDLPDSQVYLEQYKLPQQYSMSFTHMSKLRSNQRYQVDFYVISIDVWHFLKRYYTFDTEVYVFVTKHSPQFHQCFECENLEHGLCVSLQFVNLVVILVRPDTASQLWAIRTPASPEQELIYFRTYLLSLLKWDGLQTIKLCNEAHLYMNNKKLPFKGSRTLQSLGITYDMQILVACQNVSLQDIEEEIETDGEEVEQNLHDKDDFMGLLNKAIEGPEITLRIKSVDEIKLFLEQNFN